MIGGDETLRDAVAPCRSNFSLASSSLAAREFFLTVRFAIEVSAL
jgi:hypothetical protein